MHALNLDVLSLSFLFFCVLVDLIAHHCAAIRVVQTLFDAVRIRIPLRNRASGRAIRLDTARRGRHVDRRGSWFHLKVGTFESQRLIVVLNSSSPFGTRQRRQKRERELAKRVHDGQRVVDHVIPLAVLQRTNDNFANVIFVACECAGFVAEGDGATRHFTCHVRPCATELTKEGRDGRAHDELPRKHRKIAACVGAVGARRRDRLCRGGSGGDRRSHRRADADGRTCRLRLAHRLRNALTLGGRRRACGGDTG